MFLEELAMTMVSVLFVAPFLFMLLNWFCEQVADLLAMTTEDWISVAIFIGICVIITLLA